MHKVRFDSYATLDPEVRKLKFVELVSQLIQATRDIVSECKSPNQYRAIFTQINTLLALLETALAEGHERHVMDLVQELMEIGYGHLDGINDPDHFEYMTDPYTDLLELFQYQVRIKNGSDIAITTPVAILSNDLLNHATLLTSVINGPDISRSELAKIRRKIKELQQWSEGIEPTYKHKGRKSIGHDSRE